MKFNAFGKIFSIIAMLTLVFALTFAISITASAEESGEPPVTGGEPSTSGFAIEITQSDNDYRKLTVSWNSVAGARYCIYVDYEHVAVVTDGTSYKIDGNVKADQEVHVMVEALDENDVTLAVAEVLYKNHRFPKDPEQENVIEATCRNAGSYDEVIRCISCGQEKKDSRTHHVVPQLEHEYKVTVVKPATCEKDGTKISKCINGCDQIQEGTKEIVIKAKGHNWSDADCDSPKTCRTCKKTEGYALGHTWQEATCSTPKTCTVCSETSGKAVDHKYSPDTNPEAVIVYEVCEFCGLKGKFSTVQIPPAHKDTVVKVAVVTACAIVIILCIKGLMAPPSTTPWWKRRRR